MVVDILAQVCKRSENDTDNEVDSDGFYNNNLVMSATKTGIVFAGTRPLVY